MDNNTAVCYPRPVRTCSMSRPGLSDEPKINGSNINIDQISSAEIEQDFINKKNENEGCIASKEIMNIIYSPQTYDRNSNLKEAQIDIIRKEHNSKKNYQYYCKDSQISNK